MSKLRFIAIYSCLLLAAGINEWTLSFLTGDGSVDGVLAWYVRGFDSYLLLIALILRPGWRFRSIFLNLFLVLNILFSIEAASAAAFRIRNGEWSWSYGQRVSRGMFEPHPWLVGVPEANRSLKTPNLFFSHNSSGYRGKPVRTPKQKGITRIIAVGGSTTYGVGVSDTCTWPAYLEAFLGSRYEVINAGVPGYTTAEHIIQTALQLHELGPDLILYYIGCNDLCNIHVRNLKSDYSGFHGRRQYGSFDLPGIWKGPMFASVFFAIRTLQGLDLMVKTPDQRVLLEVSDAPDTQNRALGIYGKNIETLFRLNQGFGSRALFIPQVMIEEQVRARPEEVRAWFPGVEPDQLVTLLHTYNEKLKQSVSDADADLAESMLTVPWDTSDFLDYGHFSPKGNRKFAETLAGVIRSADSAAAGMKDSAGHHGQLK